MNRILSGGIDSYWRHFVTRRVKEQKPQDLLDLATGSGDLLLSLRRAHAFEGIGVGGDFCLPMLEVAHEKKIPHLCAVNAMELPYQNESFDAVTISFGYRNVVYRSKALQEVLRVLRPNGCFYILEFSHPISWWKNFYWKYLVEVLPLTAGIWGVPIEDYEYLAETIRRFPNQDHLLKELKEGGFDSIRYWNLTGGIAALHQAYKPSTSPGTLLT